MDPLEGLPAPGDAPAQAIRAACAAWRGSGGGEAALLAAASAASAAFRALATTPDAGGLDEADAVDAAGLVRALLLASAPDSAVQLSAALGSLQSLLLACRGGGASSAPAAIPPPNGGVGDGAGWGGGPGDDATAPPTDATFPAQALLQHPSPLAPWAAQENGMFEARRAALQAGSDAVAGRAVPWAVAALGAASTGPREIASAAAVLRACLSGALACEAALPYSFLVCNAGWAAARSVLTGGGGGRSGGKSVGAAEGGSGEGGGMAPLPEAYWRALAAATSAGGPTGPAGSPPVLLPSVLCRLARRTAWAAEAVVPWGAAAPVSLGAGGAAFPTSLAGHASAFDVAAWEAQPPHSGAVMEGRSTRNRLLFPPAGASPEDVAAVSGHMRTATRALRFYCTQLLRVLRAGSAAAPHAAALFGVCGCRVCAQQRWVEEAAGAAPTATASVHPLVCRVLRGIAHVATVLPEEHHEEEEEEVGGGDADGGGALGARAHDGGVPAPLPREIARAQLQDSVLPAVASHMTRLLLGAELSAQQKGELLVATIGAAQSVPPQAAGTLALLLPTLEAAAASVAELAGAPEFPAGTVTLPLPGDQAGFLLIAGGVSSGVHALASTLLPALPRLLAAASRDVLRGARGGLSTLPQLAAPIASFLACLPPSNDGGGAAFLVGCAFAEGGVGEGEGGEGLAWQVGAAAWGALLQSEGMGGDGVGVRSLPLLAEALAHAGGSAHAVSRMLCALLPSTPPGSPAGATLMRALLPLGAAGVLSSAAAAAPVGALLAHLPLALARMPQPLDGAAAELASRLGEVVEEAARVASLIAATVDEPAAASAPGGSAATAVLVSHHALWVAALQLLASYSDGCAAARRATGAGGWDGSAAQSAAASTVSWLLGSEPDAAQQLGSWEPALDAAFCVLASWPTFGFGLHAERHLALLTRLGASSALPASCVPSASRYIAALTSDTVCGTGLLSGGDLGAKKAPGEGGLDSVRVLLPAAMASLSSAARVLWRSAVSAPDPLVGESARAALKAAVNAANGEFGLMRALRRLLQGKIPGELECVSE